MNWAGGLWQLFCLFLAFANEKVAAAGVFSGFQNALRKLQLHAQVLNKGFQQASAGPDVETVFYDRIVVGGGAVGCPLARTLAESGETVLLIERGGPRSEHKLTLDIYGSGQS